MLFLSGNGDPFKLKWKAYEPHLNKISEIHNLDYKKIIPLKKYYINSGFISKILGNKYVINDSLIVNFVCPPDSTHIELFDSQIRGFYCDCLRSGRKSYRLRYRVHGKLRVLTLGDAAHISTDQVERTQQESYCRSLHRPWRTRRTRG